MVLQQLFALYALVAVPTVALSHAIIRVGRPTPLSLEIVSPNTALSEAKYPGVLVIATQATRDRAFVLATRLSESGVTTIMYLQDPGADRVSRMLYAEHALDSLRRRMDTRVEEIGVIAFGDAIDVIADLSRDTSISFAVVETEKSMNDIVAKYSRARAATLVVQGVDGPPVVAASGPRTSTLTQGVSANLLEPSTAAQVVNNQVAPSVTVWPVPRSQLEGIADNRSSLTGRILEWIREQVHAGGGPIVQQQSPLSIH